MVNFFCPAHRDWVYLNSLEALENSEHSERSGNELLRHGAVNDALSHFGCAYEAVEIFLQMHGTDHRHQITRLTTLSLATAQCFYQLRQYEKERAMLKRSIDFLNDRITLLKEGSAERGFMQFCLDALNDCLPYTSMGQFSRKQPAARFH